MTNGMTDDQVKTEAENVEATTQTPADTTMTPESTPETTATEQVAAEPAVTEPVTETAAEAPTETAPEAAPSPEKEEVAVHTPETVETPAETKPVDNVSDADLFEQAMAELSQEDTTADNTGNTRLNKGDRVEAKVIQVEKDRVFVDLGTKAEGVVPLNELTDASVSEASEVVKPGDTFEVIVLRPMSAEGSPVVSKKRAEFDQMWKGILDAFEEKKNFEAPVVERVKGGLVVDIGVRGFVPATHVGNGRLRNLDKFVGETLDVRIIEIDRDRKKVVLSNKAAEEERRAEAKDKMFTDTKVGEVMDGTVRRLTDYGAFVDLGGVDGLLHISEMSWVRIDHPREVLKVGDEIKVKVLRLDADNGRISLGLRQVLPDPWTTVRENYKVGQKVKVTISRIVQSGAFIRMPEGVEAFLPVSEMSDKRIKSPEEAINVGDEVEPTVIDLRPDDRRMVLSLRENTNYGAGVDYRMPTRGGAGGGRGRGRGRHGEGGEPGPTQPRQPSGGATIGERLGMLKGLMRGDEEGSETAEADAKTTETPDTTSEDKSAE